ncbi:hypothetical protein ABIE67_004232 [Streptomyces sp. V4I8]|uniref:hypothetical protein n=1 Tax=Streptomyces sp. V4I8 TaxID=3156469 RepID=UPI0035146980
MSDLRIAPVDGDVMLQGVGGDGLRGAEEHGFVEVDRYVASEDENEVWLTLRRAGFEVSGA